MENTHVMFELKRKRAELAGLIPKPSGVWNRSASR
jgi:hypothetical protein